MFELSKSVRKNGGVEDDLKILRTWVEYSEDRKTALNLMYEFEMEDESGNVEHLFKAIRLVRIVRLPKATKQSRVLMQVHARMLQGLWQQNIKLITVIANILNPMPFGLMYLYGVQGVARTEEEAKAIVGQDYIAFISLLQGTYRVLEYQQLSYEELEWLREKMFSMKNLTVVRGIPKAKESGRIDKTQDHGKGMGMQVDPDEEDTTEEFIAGMSDKEYVVQILSTPVKAEHLERWLAQTAQEMTRFNSQLDMSANIGFNLSVPMMYMGNVGASEGWSHAYTESETMAVTTSDTLQNSLTLSVGESINQSFGESISHSLGSSFSESVGENYSASIGTSDGTSWGESIGTGQGISQNFSENVSIGDNYSESLNDGSSNSVSTNASVSEGLNTNANVTRGNNTSVSDSVSSSSNTSYGEGSTASQGWNSTQGGAAGNSQSSSYTDSSGETNTYTHGESNATGRNWSQGGGRSGGYNYGYNNGYSATGMQGGSGSDADGGSAGIIFVNDTWSSTDGNSWSGNAGATFTENEAWNSGWNTNQSRGGSSTFTENESLSAGTTRTHSVGGNAGISTSENWSNGNSGSLSVGQSTNASTGISQSHSVNSGTSDNYTQGYGTSQNVTQGYGASDSTSSGSAQSWGRNTGLSQGTSVGTDKSANASANTGGSSGVSKNESWGLNRSSSYGQTTSDTFSQSATTTTGRNFGDHTSRTYAQGWGTSQGSSKGTSMGTTGGTSRGTSSSMGVGPSVGFGIMYKWIDQEVKNLLTLLEFQNNRLMSALKGMNGAFFTDVYIATPDKQTQEAASILAKGAWMDDSSLVCPLQVLNLRDEEQKHLLYHFSAFSADNTKVNNNRQMQSYKYSTILLPIEFTAYTHLPRISEGGVYADVGDIPKFAVPSLKKGDIYMGKILSGERWVMGDKYESIFEYRLDESELMHGIFTGESRSGKTVAATRFVAELTKVRRKKTGKRLRIVALDPKQDWRILGKFIEPERFHFYSLGNPEFLPINLNICKVPHNVNPQVWVDGIIEIFCRSYGLLERGKAILAETFYELYEQYGVFEDSPNWRDFVPERSANITMAKVFERMMKIKVALDGELVKTRGRMGTEAMDAYMCILDRLQVFGRKFSIESRLFAQTNGMAIDELIGQDDVIVLESYGLETTFKNFIFGCITSGFFKYAQGHEGGFLADDQYETVLVIEEANEVLTGSDTAGGKGGNMPSLGGQSEFEKILDQAAGLGLFIIAITQKIADMPSSCVANAGLVFAGKISRNEDVSLVIRKIGREERYDDRDMLKWFPRSPIGWFVCRSSRNFDFKETEPVLVHIDPLGVEPPNNAELEGIIYKKRALELLNS